MTDHEISQILQAIARVEVKVEQLGTDNIRAEGVHADHETRIRSLERVRWTAVGIALVIGGAGGTALSRLLGAG